MSNQQSTANPLDANINATSHHPPASAALPTPNPIAAPAMMNPNIMMQSTSTAAATPASTSAIAPPGVAMAAVPTPTPAAVGGAGPSGPKEEYEEIREQVNFCFIICTLINGNPHISKRYTSRFSFLG